MALVAHAAGILCLEAAVGLLIGHRRWLEREDFRAECVHVEGVGVSVFACVDWPAALAALSAGRLPCSGGERQVLLLAAGIADGVPVDMREALTSIDGSTAALVVDAVGHAAGLRGRVDGGWAR